MKKDTTAVNKALDRFFNEYSPYDEAEYSLYNLKEIEKDFMSAGTDKEEPKLWNLLQDAIEAITNFEF